MKVLENQVAEANARLTDDEHHVSELQSAKVKLQKEMETANAQVEELESRCSTAERAKAMLESQLAETQVKTGIIVATSDCPREANLHFV